jgi:hypothetical protein
MYSKLDWWRNKLQQHFEGDMMQSRTSDSKRWVGKKIIGLAACLLFVSATLFFVPSWRPGYKAALSNLNAVKASIRDRKEPLNFSELARKNESDFADGDRAMAILKQLKPSGDEFYKLMEPDALTPPGDYPVLRESIRVNRKALDALADLDVTKDYFFRHDFDRSDPTMMLLPIVDETNKASCLLRAKFIQSLGCGDQEQAVQAIIELGDASQLMRLDLFLVCQLVRARLAGDAVDALQQLLARVELTPQQFQVIDDRLKVMESTYRLAESIRCERASFLTTLETVGYDRRPQGMRQLAGSLNMLSRQAALIDLPNVEAKERWTICEQETKSMIESNVNDPYASVIASNSVVRITGLEHRQRLIAARLALRVARYRAEKGSLPDNLQDIVDQTMPEIPNGLMSGKPPEYLVEPLSFIIRESLDTDDGKGKDGKGKDSVKVTFEKELPH